MGAEQPLEVDALDVFENDVAATAIHKVDDVAVMEARAELALGREYWLACGIAASSGRIILMTTFLSRPGRAASHVSPMPPAPIRATSV